MSTYTGQTQVDYNFDETMKRIFDAGKVVPVINWTRETSTTA